MHCPESYASLFAAAAAACFDVHENPLQVYKLSNFVNEEVFTPKDYFTKFLVYSTSSVQSEKSLDGSLM